ncbi:DUF397 domain-containing protein [Streptomyces zaehneri]|uniref:DUF397 domain-containing protein n=1 Tax=Streptomyces zaehneri TaxID=3051180 RepID=UPI0028D06C55|nr:DUF397 domain-containing protein [Streptomyces sp. DSM 40713]
MTQALHWQKSTFSGGAEGNACVELAASWQKSTFSDGGEGNTCVELAASAAPAALHLRESDTPDTALTATPAALAHLLAGIRTGLAPQRTTSNTFF